MPDLIQPLFAKGEIAPALYARVDLAGYKAGLRTARNCIIHVTGGVSNRSGTRFIGPVKDHSYAPSLFTFDRGVTDQYLLEFGDFYMRVIRNDGHVVETAVNISGITQANPTVVTTSAAHSYSDGEEVFFTGILGMTRLNGCRFVIRAPTATTFRLEDQITGVPIDSTGFGAYTSAGTVARVFTLTTPYAIADVPTLKMVQSQDVMTITHPSYAPRDLTRADHDNWTLTIINFGPVQDHPTGLGVTVNTAGAATKAYTVVALTKDGEESLAAINSTAKTITGATAANPVVITATSHGFLDGDEVEILAIVGMTELNGRRFIVANKNANDFELRDEDGSSHTAYTSGGTASQTFVRVTNSAVSGSEDNTIAWTEVSGADKYAIYRSDNDGGFFHIGETSAASLLDGGGTKDTTRPLRRQRERFQVTAEWPTASSYYEQRQLYGGATGKPDRTDYSVVGDRKAFTQSDPLQDDDAFAASLVARKVHQIRHYVPQTDLLVFTSGGEWKVNSGQDSAFAGTTIKQKPQSTWGSSHRVPIEFGSVVLFVEYSDARVRSIGFEFSSDRYDGTDMNTFASHLLAYDGPDKYVVVDWTDTTFPEPRIFVVRSDGKVLTMTFDAKQEVVAWTTWDTDGLFERTNSLRRNVEDVEDAVFFVVQRQCCPSCPEARYIERLQTRKFADVRDGSFLDVMLSFEISATITDVTNTNPVVITAVAHGFGNGEIIQIQGIEWFSTFDENGNEVQPDFLNGGRFTVRNVTTDTFEIMPATGTQVGWVLSNASYSGRFKLVSAETTDPQGVDFNPDGTKMFLVSAIDGTLDEYSLSAVFDVSSASYESTLDVSSEDSSPLDYAFNDDGLAVYALGGTNTTIFQYTLSTAYDLSTSSYSSKSLDISSEDTDPIAFIWNDDGTSLFVLGNQTDAVYQYDLTAAYDLSTGSYASKSLDLSFLTGDPIEFFFNDDGTKAYHMRSGSDAVEQFALSTAYDLSTASHETVGFTTTAQDTTPQVALFSSAGDRLYVLGAASDTVYEYLLATAWDLNTASHNGVTLDVSSEDGTPVGLTIKGDGTKLWMVGNTNDTVYEYDMAGTALVDGGANYRRGGIAYLEQQTVTGAPHLDGCDVVILADGNVIDGLFFSGGSVTLPEPAARIKAGLRYTADVELLNIEASNGTIQGKKVSVTELTIRLEKSRGMLVGPHKDDLTEMKFRVSEKMGDPDELLTGDITLPIPADWKSNGRAFFRQRNPLPMTILGVVTDLETEDD